MKVYASIDGSLPIRIHGPADLARLGKGDVVWVLGDPKPEDHGPWAPALGGAVLRGVCMQSTKEV